MQCREGRIHMHPAYSFVEILDAQGRPTDGEGCVVGTTFHNLAMPLLRYRVDDSARWARQPCPCGCTYPVIEALSGRVGDAVFDLDGQPVTAGVITFAFKGVPHIDRAQLAQVAQDLWEVRVVPLPGFSDADQALLLANFVQKVSPRLALRVVLREQIPNLPSGKYQWIVQEWKRR
jgi:phenylacetate-CoA ligase